jgi:hypothetical protein
MLKIPARFKQCDLSVSLAFDYCDCIVNMGTRAAACKQLYTFYVVLHGVSVNIGVLTSHCWYRPEIPLLRPSIHHVHGQNLQNVRLSLLIKTTHFLDHLYYYYYRKLKSIFWKDHDASRRCQQLGRTVET